MLIYENIYKMFQNIIAKIFYKNVRDSMFSFIYFLN